MAVLSKEQLFGKVTDAITSNDWEVKNKSSESQQPVRYEIANGDETQILRVYIWNLTHGGESRPLNEYRIQVKVDRFEEESNSKTLILGYYDDLSVFAGFDISKHIGKPGWSASMQIKKKF
jgi:putative restriction endonuclease